MYRELKRDDDHVWVLANIKYTVALFSALDVSVRKKQHATCTIFSAFCTKANRYTSTYFILSRLSDRLIFRNSLSLWG